MMLSIAPFAPQTSCNQANRSAVRYCLPRKSKAPKCCSYPTASPKRNCARPFRLTTCGASSILQESASSEEDATIAGREPLSLEVAPMGVTIYSTGEASFRLWAPHATNVMLQMHRDEQGQATESVALSRNGDIWEVMLAPGGVSHGDSYQLLLTTEDGRQLLRRDPYARTTDFESTWCFVDDPSVYKWTTDWTPPTFDRYLIYEMHIGSYTPVGTFESVAERLEHVAALGFTAVQVMPICEHSDKWGYNPRQLMSVHPPYGSPDDLRALVDKAHSLGLAVIVDIVLHHGAPSGNELWEFDGWGPDWNGGIYHEGAPDTQWGRQWAYWKNEVRDMVESACSMWLGVFKCDGLRFDSGNDLPHDLIQHLTYSLHRHFPGRILIAEITPENPQAIHHLGLDALWIHSGYFDIIQQHRALGRGHHGGGDWADGWNLPRLRTVMALHYGFENPTQCVKYLLGSHDQIGCQHGGKWYQDYQPIGGNHRYPADQYGGGRTDSNAMSATRAWYTAGIGAAGLHMLFMGTEWGQTGWWDNSEERRLQWDLAEDEIGQNMLRLVGCANALRAEYPALRYGWPNVLHEDRANGVMAVERVAEGQKRMLIVVNAGRGYWQDSSYGVWINGGCFEEVFSSQREEYGGSGVPSNADRGPIYDYDGKLFINLPATCTLVFKQAD